MDVIGCYNGLYYKIGFRGRLYYKNGTEWVRSSQDPETIINAIQSKERPFSVTEPEQHIEPVKPKKRQLDESRNGVAEHVLIISI